MTRLGLRLYAIDSGAARKATKEVRSAQKWVRIAGDQLDEILPDGGVSLLEQM